MRKQLPIAMAGAALKKKAEVRETKSDLPFTCELTRLKIQVSNAWVAHYTERLE